VTLYVYWFCECQSSTTGGRMVSNELYEGEQSHGLHNPAPIETNWLLVMEYTHIRYSDITTCIDSVSARAAQLEDGWSPNELYEGEQSHAYIIKHPIWTQLTPCDGIHSHQVQWHYYVYWFCECQSKHTGDGWSSKWIVWGRAVSSYIIKHPLKHNWLLAMEYTDIRYSDITMCIDSVSARAAQLEDGCLQMNCMRESSLMLT